MPETRRMKPDTVRAATLRLPRRVKQLIALSADALALPALLAIAYALHHGQFGPYQAAHWYLVALSSLISVPIFLKLGLYRAVIHFMGARAVFTVVKAVTLAVIGLALVSLLFRSSLIVASVMVIYWALAIIYVGGSRLAVRAFLRTNGIASERIAIYGAGEAGARLAAALVAGREYLPVAFVDDNESLQGSVINGIDVHDPVQLPSLVKDYSISRVFLAMPTVPRRIREKILQRLEPLRVHVQTLPDYRDLISGKASFSELREVSIDDLLGREAVPPHQELLSRTVEDKSVLVTGAGGSIGSELCRQIISMGARRLVLLDISEPALYRIEQELSGRIRAQQQDVELVPLLGSAHHRQRVRAIMSLYDINTVYHAAAYKHVPIVEQNVSEGVHNNILSTWHTAEAARDCEVETFVLISSDKAVSPTNVMGATKRYSELILQALQKRGSKTKFCLVRFGNVLDSSGSVVPLFRKQIERGGPVTVTHPDIIRYFMTIPEAAQLVIQAGSMAQGGDVFVLDMGKPVRIDDLAKRMVRLMGLQVFDETHPDGDIEIEYIGLRPAEKLYEELLVNGNMVGTQHPRIMRAEERSLSWDEVSISLEKLTAAVNVFDCDQVRKILQSAVPEYQPPADIADFLWQARLSEDTSAKVTLLAAARRRERTDKLM